MKLKFSAFSKIFAFPLAFCLLSHTALAAPQKVYNAESMMLPNGMQVVVIPNHRAPVVTHMVWYKVGAADEPQGDGVSGAAHFLEHLMFKGTEAIEPGQFSKLIRSWGGEDNAFTSYDFTAYYQSVSKNDLPRVMAMEADRMINLKLPDKEIESERDVITEERRMRVENDPQSLFTEQMRSVLFAATNYAVPVIGWKHEMPLLKKSHVIEYYKTWYAPNNAILVISGDVTMTDVAPLAKKFYGILPSRDVPEHTRPVTPDFPSPVTLTFESEDLRQPVLIQAWRAPSYMMDKTVPYALDVLMETLSGGASTELYQSLVVNQKIATDISMSYDGDARGEASIWLSAVPAPNVSLEKLKTAIDAKLSELVTKGVTRDAVEKAKTRLVDSEIYARDSVMGPAMVVGQGLSYGLTLEEIETRPEKIGQVSVENVRAVLKTYIDPQKPQNQPVVGYLVPKAKAPQQEGTKK